MPIFRPNSEAGFTLVEMLVVITVVGLLMAVVAPRLSGAHDVGARPRTKAMVRLRLDAEREQAIATGRTQTVSPDALVAIDSDLRFAGTDSVRQLTYYADGSASGGSIVRAGHVLLSVDSLTGRIADAS